MFRLYKEVDLSHGIGLQFVYVIAFKQDLTHKTATKNKASPNNARAAADPKSSFCVYCLFICRNSICGFATGKWQTPMRR